MAKKKIAVGAWAYIWGGYEEAPIPLETVAKGLKDLKFDGIELAAFPPHLDPADFNTRVNRVLPTAVGKGAEIHIRLKQPGSFLYRQEGHYLYLDVERATD